MGSEKIIKFDGLEFLNKSCDLLEQDISSLVFI